MDRKAAARRLGCTTAYLCASLDKRFLHPIREGKRVFYERADVENALVLWKRERLPRRESQPLDYRERLERGRIASEVAKILQAGGSYQDCLAKVRGDVQWIDEVWLAYHKDPLERQAEKVLDDTVKDLRARRDELDERQSKHALSLERIRIRQQLATADLERARRGEASSTVFETHATATEDGAPALPPIPTRQELKKKKKKLGPAIASAIARVTTPTPKKTG
jgi:hypothetical protein